MTSRMSISSPICTQFASCMEEEDLVSKLILLYNYFVIITNNSFILGIVLGIFTCGKPLMKRPRPTRHTTGTMTIGLNSLIQNEESQKELIYKL